MNTTELRKMSVKEFLKHIKKQYNIRYFQVADFFGVTPGNVSHWNREDKIPLKYKHLIEEFITKIELENGNQERSTDTDTPHSLNNEVKEFVLNATNSNQNAQELTGEEEAPLRQRLFPHADHVKSGEMIFAAIDEFRDRLNNWCNLSASRVQGANKCEYSIRMYNQPTGRYVTAYYDSLDKWITDIRILAPNTMPLILKSSERYESGPEIYSDYEE